MSSSCSYSVIVFEDAACVDYIYDAKKSKSKQRGCQANGVVEQLGTGHGIMNSHAIINFNLFKINDFFNIVKNPSRGTGILRYIIHCL